MTTNLLNNLSNVLKKGPSETQKNPLAFEEQSAAEKLNRVLITCLSRVNHLIKVRCMRYAALLLVLLLAGIGNAWGAMELANINFKSWTPQSISAGSTVNGCYFKSAVTITAANGATFGGNATTSSNWVAIPLSGINGSITITLTHASSRPQWKNYFKGLNAAPSSSDLSSNPSSVGDNTPPGSNTTTSSWTINTDKLYGVFYVGKGSNGLNDIYSITITTPDWTYYYRGADNSWGADAMTKSSEGFYSYKSSSTNDHQFKIAKSTSSWDYNYSFVDAGYLGTSITTISNGDNNNCYISSAPASYYIIVFRPGSAMNTTASPKICASATLPAEKFTISFNNGGGSGSMSSISNVVYGSEKATTANTFTKSGYRFTGWKADVDVKVGGATKTAGTLLDDEVTIQEIKSDITLTAQWEVDDGCNKIFWFANSADATTNGVTNNTTTFSGVDAGATSVSGSITIDGKTYTATGRGSNNSNAITFTVPANKVGTLYGLANSSGSSARTLTLTNTASYSETQSTSASSSTAGAFTFEDMPAGSYSLAWSGNGAENMLCLKLCDAPAGCDATQPGALSKGTLSGCSRTITASGSAATNNTWYWQSSASGTDKSDAYSSGKAITEAGTYYLRSFCSDGAGCWSDAVSVEITAADMTPSAPTALAAASPTAKGATLTVTDANDVNNYEFYVSTSSTAPEAGATATHSVSSAKSLTITNLVAGTQYYAWARSVCGVSNKSGWTALTGNTFTTSTVNADYHLTNVTKSSGATTGIGGSTFTAVFAAVSGYSLPSPVVTIGGNSATSGTDYTWTAGTGTLTINANKINGDIDITINSAVAAPSSVAISGDWLYFAGETIELTATPTGGNGPVTYQWYKGGKTDGDEIEGATSATYSKASCAYEDAGSYYCKVTCGGSASTWGQSGDAYDVKIPRLYVKTGHNYDLVKPDYGNVDFTRATASTATASISLGSNWDYCFNIADGCGHYYGNAGTMQYNNYGPWTTNVNNQDCGLRTTNGATYVFTINYSNWTELKTTVTFPSSDQAADKIIYFDNQTVDWSTLHYRIGRADHTQATPMTKVPGTNNLYTVTTAAYSNAAGWHIANNAGWTGSNSIYRTYTNGDEYSITYATAHEGGAVTDAAVTVTPTTSRGTGADAGINDNCTFYNYEITTGMKTQNVAISDYSNGTITVNYVNTSNEAATLTSGNADLAHSVILTSITAVPNTGYDASAITINGGAYSANYVVTGATTIAASFTPHVYNITYKDQGDVAFSGTHVDSPSAHPTTHTYATATTLNSATKTGYTFGGWFTNSACTGDAVASLGATAYSADITLYAKWTALPLVTWTMNTNTGTWGASATSTTDGTNIGSIATERTAGSDGKREGATAKVTMADAEVTGSAAPSNSANFTFTIKSSTKQVEISKFDCKVFNVGGGNRTYKAQISDEAGNVYNSTNTVAVSAEATLTDASFVFGSGKILRGDVTIRIYAWKTSGSPTEFRMGPDVKFYGTVEDYECATPSAPTISGVSEYVPGQTITLTASHDGENYDNLTTYTWYKGDTWGSKSQVQAAATGSAGYTFTKASCAAGDAGKYWCEVANGTCNAHNSEGYNIIVYPTYSITYNLNGGTNPVDPAPKTSYTQFDEDYTLPIPTKDGFVFAGWYEASDFSGLPTSLIETNSIGDKSFYAKWGSAVTATWTVTKVDDKLYRGGGGYSVKAVIDQTAWNDSYKDQLELTATEGVTLKNIVASVVSSHVQVTADFDITTGLAADATEITFTLDVPADGTYAPAELTHDEDLTCCAGSSTVWDFTTNDFLNGGTWSTSSGAENKAYATDGTTILKYYAGGSSDEWDSSNEQLKTQGATDFSTGTGKKQMTKKYFLFPTLSGKGTISVVYGTTNSTLKIYEATSTNIYGLDPIITLTSSSPTSSAYTFSGEKKYYMTMESNKVYFKRITFTASSGGITPTLSWTPALNTDGDWDSGNNRLNKETGDVDFTFVAVQDKNSLGAITYSSNNPSVATVNAAGTVHIVGAAGDATITATLAASGCFEEATATYNIQVVDNCIDEPGTISATDLGCSGIQMTVSGHTTSGETVSYQWYKVGTPDETVGTNSATFTTTEAGEYYVVVTNTGTDHCSMASTNTVKVASKAAATATKIVDEWYVKNGRRTPDVALVQTAGATDFIVKNGETTIWNSDSTTTTGFGGCGFHMGTDGIIYLNGTKDNGDATTGLTAGDVTLKITANDGCGSSASELSITIHCQEATNYKEIAFVVDGDKGKGFDQVTSGHADGTELYEYLDSVGTAAGKRLFRLTEQNIYSTTDEKAIRQHYSQYDAILITDDPSTNKVPNKEDYKTGGYVNAFGTMIDVRPILTMEAYVSALKNWGSKGIAGNPQSPNPRQYEMRLECKDHEIYGAGLPDPEDGTNVWEEVIDGETFRHVILVDSTKGIYNGVAYNVETAGDKKPALQGFTGEAAGSLLGLGRISEGTLQAAIERQEEPAARLLVMGINAKALHETSALTDEGKTVIKNILVYLLKTNMEEVDDCSNYFTGKNSSDWNNASNWSKNQLPSSEAKVRILAPCVISGVQPHVAQVAIVSSGKSSIRETATGSANCNGSLTINANGALIVEGEVLAADAPHFAHNDLKPTTVNDLIINTNGSGQAALIFDNEEAKTKATVNLYSLGRKDGSYLYQYFAIPMEYLTVSPTFANETHGGTKILTYAYTEAGGWERRGYYADLYAFEGLGITTNTSADHMSYQMKGTLASTATKEINMTNTTRDGFNLIGNSWSAPIQINKLSEDNSSDDIIQTAYVYCTGNDGGTGAVNPTEGAEATGQWIAIPFATSGESTWRESKLSVIPTMQAFQIQVKAGKTEAALTLDYKKVVRGSTNSLNEKLRAPKRTNAHSDVPMSIIRVKDSKTYTDVCLLEGEIFSDEFDNGWEAEYMAGDGPSATLYAETEIGHMAVAAMPEIEGTVLGFAPGKEREYTFTFLGADMGYYLNDIKLQQSTQINVENSYTFTFEEGDTNRFYISKTPIDAGDTPTGVSNTDATPKAQKFIYQDKLYILRNGALYDATGKKVNSK